MELNTEYDIEKAFRAIENELIASMIRNLDAHRAEETEQGYNWTQWQVEQLAALEKYKKKNKKTFSGKFSNINASIESMITIARAAGGTEQEQKILRAIKNGFKASKVSQGIEGAFFKLNTRKLNALIEATKNDFKKAEKAMLRMSEDKYRQIIFNAQVYANTGAGTYEKAVDMATRDFLKSGINCIEYKNGSRHTIKDYAKMAIQTANKRAYLTGEGEMRQSWGISTVIMKKRSNACPKCLPFVGKILIDDVWSGGKASDGPYPLMSSAMEAGLYHPNCKDIHTTYFPGLDEEPDSRFANKELEQIKEDYRQEQKQQYAERKVEQFDRLSKYSLDPDNQKMYAARKEQCEKQAQSLRNNSEYQDRNNEAKVRAGGKEEKLLPSEKNKLSDEDIRVLYEYISSKSYVINEKLRNATELTLREKNMVDKLNETLDKIPKYEGNLQRSLYFKHEDDINNYMKLFEIGKPVEFKQFLSTTKGEVYNEEGQVQIYIQNAHSGRDISSINEQEQEVLYKQGQMFKVINIVKEDNKHYILLEELNE